MNYKETMDYIENLGKFGVNLGLKRTKKILELLGNPEKNLKIVHVAGTNGKGSTCAMLNEVFINNNLKVGLYTSPFVEEFQERIKINNVNISKEDLAKVVSVVKEKAQEVEKMGLSSPTEFEVITCAMYYYFFKEKVDICVVEVGLGGREDSTNVITPIISVIASISFDHMNILGDTIEKIAYEKAGIIKENTPCVVYKNEESVLNVIKQVAKEKHGKLVISNGKIEEEEIVKNSGSQKFKVKTKEDTYNVELSLLGGHQVKNALLVINTLEEINKLIDEGKLNFNRISKEVILKSLKNVFWMGRLEILNKDPLVVIDAGHNYDGIKNLKESVNKYFKYKRLILVLGILADKEVEKMCELITKDASLVIAVSPKSSRASNLKELADSIRKFNDNVIEIENEDYNLAFNTAFKEANKDDLVLVSGSFYLIGDMRKVIRHSLKK